MRRPGVARRASNFLLLRQKKVTKEKATPSLRPLRGAKGQTCVVSVAGCAAELTARRRAPFKQLRRVSSRSMGASTPMPPRNRPAAGAASRGGVAEQPTSIRAIAALGLVSRAQAPRAAQAGPSEAKARVDVWSPLPLWMRRGAQGLADQGSRLSERSETERVRARPRQTRAPQVAPARSGGDADSGVALSLVPFFRRRERKGLACRATPGLRPQRRQAIRCAQTHRLSTRNRCMKPSTSAGDLPSRN